MQRDFEEQLDRAIAAAGKHEKELLRYPGVIAVGAGPRRRGGRLTGEAAIVVTVRRKGDDERPVLPRQLEDVPVDVIAQGEPVEAPEIRAALEKARRVLGEVRDRWLRAPNVTGIGIGYKRVKGEMDFNRIALIVFVEQKLAPADVIERKLEPVPEEIDGVVTDVQQMARVRPVASASGSRSDRKDPLVGGITVGVNTKPFWSGTLGAIVFDRTTGERMVLSNQHVLDGPAGTEVVQPSPIGLDDSIEIGFQLDVCNPLHFFRFDTPNTTVGSVLAGAAVAAVIAASLSDEIDPTREGQEATVPPAGARTLLERQRVRLRYPELPVPGRHFTVNTDWKYTRHTDAGDFSHGASAAKVNSHVLADKLLLTDRGLYHPGDTIRLFGLILPEVCAPKFTDHKQEEPLTAADIERLTAWRGKTHENLRTAVASPVAAVAVEGCRCDRYQATAILTPTSVDRAFPIVLREPVVKWKGQLMAELLQLVQRLDNRELLVRAYRLLRYGCLYTGELTVGNIPIGPWKHYLYVQTVNYAKERMKPTEAARIIGGLPVSNNTRPTLDVACGPIVYEDGQFDIELL